MVRRIKADEKTAGGGVIPDTAREPPQEGQVIAIGPGARNERGDTVALNVKSENRVLFSKWSGIEIMSDGQELLIMKEWASWL
jgi:chaperonin GroES